MLFFMKMILKLLFMSCQTWHNRLKQRKALKKEISKELMSVAWNPTRWWHWCIP